MAHDARETTRPGLARLHELDDYRVADGDPDIRGWTAVGRDGRAVGEVHDLIVDLGAMKVRYMDVEVDRDAAGIDTDRHVLIPIGCARLDDDDDRVIVDTITVRDAATIPAYAHGPIDRETEIAVRDCHRLGLPQSAARTTASTPREDEFYTSPHFDEGRFWGNRRQGREQASYLSGPVVIAEEVEVRRPVDTNLGDRGTAGGGRATSDPDRDRFRDEPRP